MKNKKYIFAECTSDGQFQGLLMLESSQIIYMDDDPNMDGIYRLEYEDGMEKSRFFLEFLEFEY